MAVDLAVLRGEALLGFVFDACSVRYQASAEPQRLVVEASFSRPMERANEADAWVDDVVEAGLGGGAEFSPEESSAEALAGDFASLLPSITARTDHRWELSVAGVSPKYLRHVAESLRGFCTRLRIEGELALDDGPLSCTERDLQRWVASAEIDAYRGLWEPLPYELEEEEVHRCAAMRIFFDEPVPPDAVDEPYGLAWRMAALTGHLSGLLDHAGRRAGAISLVPSLSRGKADLAVRWDHFDLAHDAARALMLSTVTHLHQTAFPVRRVLLQLS